MAITRVGGDFGNTGPTNNTDDLDDTAGSGTALTLPSHQAGDLLLAHVCSSNGTTCPDISTSSSGWVENTDARAQSTTETDVNIQTFWKIATSGSETNPAFQKAATCRAAGVIQVWRGVSDTTPFDVIPTTDTTVDAGTWSIPPAITPVTANGALIYVCHAVSIVETITTGGAPASPSGLSVGSTAIGSGGNYQDVVTAYLEDYGTAAEIISDYWNNVFGIGTIMDGDDQGNYNTGFPEGSFDGGTTGHVISDVVTLSQGITITVDAVSSGVVTQFTVDSTGDVTGGLAGGDDLTFVSSTGSGDDFTLTVGRDNLRGREFELAMVAIALRPNPVITSVSTDDVIGVAENPWNITGTNFGDD